MSSKNYDELLYPILCSEGNIFDFFDKIFEFLYRRTDFFRIKTDKSSSMGFELGEAEKIVRNVFGKYMEQAINRMVSESATVVSPALDFIAEEVVSTTELDIIEDLSTIGDNKEVHTAEKPDRTKQQSDIISWMDPDCYNGAKFDDYSWAQTLNDVDIRIKVPKSVMTGKQVQVKIEPNMITAKTFTNGKWDILKEGELSCKINVEESTWTLVPGEHIHICLQKIQERWWDSLFKGDPKIDLKLIDSSLPYEDLDEESQAKISELMYNEFQKKLGKPTIQQSKIENILKEAWNSEGSPFKDQPYDPTSVDIQNADALLP